MTRLAASLALVAGAAAAQPMVTITAPTGREPVFGAVEIAAEATCDGPVARLELVLDGRRVARLTAPPFTATADAGQENAEHSFRAVLTCGSGETAAAALTTPRFEVNEEVTYELQQLYVTVTDGGEPVLDLGQADFEVLDDSVRQELRSFERGDVPFTAVLLLDASASMAGPKLRAALAGADAFAAGMKAHDEARLLAFSDRLLAATPFVGAGGGLLEATSGLSARGGTALNDHLYLALTSLERRQGRRVIVLLSDGLDSHSVLTIDDVLPAAERSRALLYWLRLEKEGDDGARNPGSQHSAWRDGKAHERQIERLERAVLRSGGRIAPVRDPEGITAEFAAVLRELRAQYVLGYYPHRDLGTGAWHEVEVRLARRGAAARTARGYYDF